MNQVILPTDWGGKRYYSLNTHLRHRFGHKVFKVSLDAGFTCPNRDGTLSWEGCHFCSPRGSGDFAGERGRSLEEQHEQVIQLMQRKWSSAYYIAYLQAFTNTYAPPVRLREIYRNAQMLPGVVGLAIATRPDCIGNEVLEILQECQRETFLWVELGLQTIHPRSSRYLNMGYDYSDFLQALTGLQERKIETCAHLILGLPGENRADMMASAQALARLPLQGVKLHLMHLMRGTPLAHRYQAADFPFMSQEEYVELVVDILEILPQNMVIHRLTGDSPRHLLLGPMWSLHKWEVLNHIDRRLEERDTWQGKKAEEPIANPE
ncbi:MAG TPA: TIGR01212 family radical SAM protein [Syntrophomonadaceae bacterium]|nr:TIGR01212 family radical SAM protein [Syntrophomonadaceae bacterium]